MFFHIVLTDECNLMCRYCYAEAFEDACGQKKDRRFADLPSEVRYPVDDLIAFLKKDPDGTVTFYGGEPTLRPELMRRIIDALPGRRFMMQTNGILLKNVGAEHLKRMHTILISVDGRPELTDDYRGIGVFETVRNNIAWLRSEGFKGEIVARMTVMEETDIYDAVTWLYGCGLFDSVHWQLNANFWNDLHKRDFAEWSETSYNPGIRKLAEWWLRSMKRGRVPKLYPFLGVMQMMLKEERAKGVLCGAGHSNFAVATDGSIYPCPVVAGLKRFKLGDIWASNPAELKSGYELKECGECNDFGRCGGRCLYGNYMMPWGKDGHALVCGTVKSMISSLERILPEVRGLLASGKLEERDFDYVKYNGAEIIP